MSLHEIDLPSLSFQFRKGSYSADEQEALSEAVGDGFRTSLKPVSLPEAGGSTEIWAIPSIASELVSWGCARQRSL